MSTTQKTGKKKLVVSLILFIVALIFFGSAIYCLVAMLTQPKTTSKYFTIMVPLILAYFILLILAIVLNFLYRRQNAKPGALSTALLIVCLVMLIGPLGIALYFLGALAGGNTPKTFTVKDENGNELTLTASSGASNEYKDQSGDLWKTYDGGKTFERVNIKAADDEGNEKTLTPTYDSILTKHYQDQDGEEWKSQDGGQTFEHVVTHATVKDKDGNEYSLRAIQAGLDNYIDQNGDMWTTYDGGKTFERR